MIRKAYQARNDAGRRKPGSVYRKGLKAAYSTLKRFFKPAIKRARKRIAVKKVSKISPKRRKMRVEYY